MPDACTPATWLDRTVRFAEAGEDVRWVHALASTDVDWEGDVVPLSDPVVFATVFESMRRQIEGADGEPPVFQPFYLVGHNDGPSQGGLPPMNLGQFRRVHLATREELARQGVDVVEPLHILLGCDLNAVGQKLDAHDQLPNGSVKLAFGYDDHRREGGKASLWPGWLHEFSATPNPYLKTLRSARDTAHLRFSDDGETMTPEQLKAALATMKAENPEGYATMMAELTAGDGAPDDGKPKPPPVGGVKMSEPADPPAAPTNVTITLAEKAELEALRTEVPQLREEVGTVRQSQMRREVLELCEKDRVIIRDAEGELNEELVGTLVQLRMSDERQFDTLFKTLGRDARQPSQRQAKGGAKIPSSDLTFSESPTTQEEVAANKRLTAEYADKHNVTFSEARAALRKLHAEA